MNYADIRPIDRAQSAGRPSIFFFWFAPPPGYFPFAPWVWCSPLVWGPLRWRYWISS